MIILNYAELIFLGFLAVMWGVIAGHFWTRRDLKRWPYYYGMQIHPESTWRNWDGKGVMPSLPLQVRPNKK